MKVLCALNVLLGVASTQSHLQIPLGDQSSGLKENPTATIDAGVIIGTTTLISSATARVNQFLGIPFAKSPPDRFLPPESPRPFATPILTQRLSPACIQQFQYPKSLAEFKQLAWNNPPPEESEDCLYLNVYAPATPAPPDGRAVMYWIHGGALEFGNAGHQWYDGSMLAANKDVIIVTANYRTNVFGFPASPDIPISKRNIGFLDQRFGLDWVQRNIRSFGGSPSRVTIFGESAGGLSVDALVTSYSKDRPPPFRAAIAQSGQMSFRALSRFASSEESWRQLVSALDCPEDAASSLECARAASVSEIKEIIEVQSLTFNPTQDNVTLVSDPIHRRTRGNIAEVPVMGGSTAQEGRVFAVNQTDPRLILSTVITNDDDLIDAIISAYPLGKDGIVSGYDQVSQILTEMSFQCPQALWANATAAAQIPVWRYYFNASFANTEPYPDLGVFHSSEIPVIFRTYPSSGATAQQHALSISMMNAWVQFAKDPSGGPGWKRSVVNGTWDLAVFGNMSDSFSADATMINELEIDFRCQLFRGILGAE